MAINPEDCTHERFESLTRVGRLTAAEGGPVTSFAFECKVRCLDCETFFEFVGVPGGVSFEHPTTNFDFTELRIPIRPNTGDVQTNMKYQLAPSKIKKENIN